MSWITPFTNWLARLAPLPSDMNRIEGNIQYLKDRGDATRTMSLIGDVTGSTNYDDNGGITVSTAVIDNSHNHVSSNITDASSASIPGTVVKRDSAGNFLANTIGANRFDGALNGNATTASKLATGRTITISGQADGAAVFDGSGNIEISIQVSYSSFATNAGNASYATSAGFSNTSNACSGNAATATTCTGNSATATTATFAYTAERNKYYIVPVLPSATDFDGIIVKRSSDDSVWIAIASNWYKLSN